MRLLLMIACAMAPVWAGDADFNGRWLIRGVDAPSIRAWNLEVTGAGTPAPGGYFVTAMGGDRNQLTDLKIQGGELSFSFTRRNREGQVTQKATWKARLNAGGKLDGTYEVEGRPVLRWVGWRAPVIAEFDDGTWVEGQPVALFNGKDLAGWSVSGGGEAGWKVEDGILKNAPGVRDLLSDKTFWNFRLVAEYRLGEHSNSGIALRGRYEVQLLEDFGRPPSTHGHGALYSRILPAKNASKPAGEWQRLEIRLVGREVTIVLNGETIIAKKEIEGLTAMATNPDEDQPGPLQLQGDHGIVEFRKIEVTPLMKARR